MSLVNIATVDALYQAFDSGNWPQVLETLAKDVVWTQPGSTRLSKMLAVGDTEMLSRALSASRG